MLKKGMEHSGYEISFETSSCQRASLFGAGTSLSAAEKHPRTMKERIMLTIRNQRASIYVHRASRQWVVRDSDGRFWTVTPIEDAWEHRQPFTATDETELEPVPGHYKDMLGLPF
jgi:hypothetical protein